MYSDVTYPSEKARFVSANMLGFLVFLTSWFFFFHTRGVTDPGYIASEPRPSIFYWLYDRWILNDWVITSYAVNFTAPLFALFLIWRRRQALRSAPLRVAWEGALLLVGGLVLHLIGAKTEQTRLSILAMLIVLWGGIWFALGRRIGRLLTYPFTVAALITPLNFFDAALNPVRVAASKVAALLAAGVGLPVVARGSDLFENSPGGWIVTLSDSTSSIHALLALLMATMVVADFIPSTKRAVSLVMLTPLFFWLANVFRGFSLSVLASALGSSAALYINTRFPALLLVLGFAGGQLAWLWLMTNGSSVFREVFQALRAQHVNESARLRPRRDVL